MKICDRCKKEVKRLYGGFSSNKEWCDDCQEILRARYKREEQDYYARRELIFKEFLEGK